MQQELLAAIRANPDGIMPPQDGGTKGGWPEGTPDAAVNVLLALGFARRLDTGAIVPAEPEATTDWIWLPNSLVDGAAGETPPLERVREAHNLIALRLLVDLYHAQSLALDGGVNWRKIRTRYHRSKVGEYGEFDIYAFWPDALHAFGSAPFVSAHLYDEFPEAAEADGSMIQADEGWSGFWAALEVLTATGVAEFVPHLVTADRDDGTVIHPLAGPDEGEEAEREVAAAAHAAALAMLRSAGQHPDYAASVQLVPVRRHVSEVSVVGLLRLRHRANTSATQAWFGRMEEWRRFADRYRAHERSAGRGSKGLRATSMGHAKSTGHQRGINDKVDPSRNTPPEPPLSRETGD